MDRWVGKIAVVTGASGGIGGAIAKTLADKGVIVVAIGRRLEKLQNLASSTKGQIHLRVCDVQSETDILNTFKWIEDKIGGVDILVNSVGIFSTESLISGEMKNWVTTMNTNVLGISLCTREAIKSMRKRGDCGQIFHINSIFGHRYPNIHKFTPGMYCASKFALKTLANCLRLELIDEKSNIKITTISPGTVKTEMTNFLFDDSKTQKDNPPYTEAEDIAEAVIFILSTRPIVQIREMIIHPVGMNY